MNKRIGAITENPSLEIEKTMLEIELEELKKKLKN